MPMNFWESCFVLLCIGNTQMSCSSSGISPSVLCYYPGRYYHFRCEVKESLRQVWRVDGAEELRLGPTSTTNDHFPEEPLNFFIDQVTTVDNNPQQTTFVSYLWFNSSKYVPTTVACESATHTVSIMLKPINGMVNI